MKKSRYNYFKTSPLHPFFIHDHDYFEIIYILKGNAIQTIEDKVVELQAGHLFLLAPQIKHGIKVFNDETVLLNIFN